MNRKSQSVVCLVWKCLVKSHSLNMSTRPPPPMVKQDGRVTVHRLPINHFVQSRHHRNKTWEEHDCGSVLSVSGVCGKGVWGKGRPIRRLYTAGGGQGHGVCTEKAWECAHGRLYCRLFRDSTSLEGGERQRVGLMWNEALSTPAQVSVHIPNISPGLLWVYT